MSFHYSPGVGSVAIGQHLVARRSDPRRNGIEKLKHLFWHGAAPGSASGHPEGNSPAKPARPAMVHEMRRRGVRIDVAAAEKARDKLLRERHETFAELWPP